MAARVLKGMQSRRAVAKQTLMNTVVENHRKSRIQHRERSELCLYFEWAKVHGKMPKMVNLGEFLKMRLFW